MSTNITRRDFLKGAATICAASAAVSVFPSVNPLVKLSGTAKSSNVEWKANFCSGCHQPTCGTRVKVQDGVVVGVEGDPKSDTNQGALCIRGLSIPMSLYNPYRVKAPMKRTNPVRGLDQDPGWVEISWDEALDITAKALKEARDYDPRSFIFSRGFGFEEQRLAFDRAFGTPNVLGTPGALCPEHFTALHLSGTMLDRADLERCNYMVVAGRSFGGDFAIASSSTRNLMDAVNRGMKLVTISPVDNRQAQIGEWVPIRPGTDTALGLALGNVIIHELGTYDEWWLKVRTNAPYLMEDKEADFIEGTQVFFEDYARDEESGKPLVWDSATNAAVPFDTSTGETYALRGHYLIEGKRYVTAFQAYADYIEQFTPEWAEPITTIPATKVREIAANLVKEAQIGSTITIDGYEFPFRPACINIGRGAVTNRLGSQAYKAYGAINVMLGCIDVPGGMQGCQTANQHPFLTADEDGILVASEKMAEQNMGAEFAFPVNTLDMVGMYPMKHNTTVLGWKAILEPEKYYIEYTPKALMIHAANPVTSNANKERVIKAWNKLDFIVDIAYHFDEPAVLADVLLPEDHSLERTNAYRLFRNEKERTDQNGVLQGTFIKTPAVDRVYNTRNLNDIFLELAKRIGFLPDLLAATNKSVLSGVKPGLPAGLSEKYALDPSKEYSWEEILERKIKTDFGDQASYADFAESSFKAYKLDTVKESYNYSYAPENAIRQPFYYQRMTRIAKDLKANLEAVNAHVPGWDNMEDFYRHYSGFAIWYEPYNYGVTDEYQFKVANWKTHYMVTNTYGTIENPWIQEVLDRYAPDMKVVMINPITATKLGFSEGDEIEIQAEHAGTTKGNVHITALVHPEVAGIAGNFGRLSPGMNPIVHEGSQFNQLCSDEEFTLEPVMGNLENSPRVKIRKI